MEIIEKRKSPKRSAESIKRKSDKEAAKQRLERRNPQFSAKWLTIDCRAMDRRRGRQNDLTLDFVASVIVKGCFYCGESGKAIIGLDRIDNSLGHTQANVNPCCRRCNWMRRDMPFEAWMQIVPVVRDIHKKGLFGDWHAGPKRHPQVLPS